MELQDLSTYARETYQLYEETGWIDQPGISVIRAKSGKLLAVLMKEYSEETGEIIERCDIKCGPVKYEDMLQRCVTMPFLMKGSNWAGIIIDDTTDAQTVFRLFECAVEEERKQGYTVILDNHNRQTGIYHSTPLPSSPFPVQQPQRKAPERILQMQAMYKEYPGEPLHISKARNFYNQAKFMEDYEDEQYKEWRGKFHQYYCTYHDLSMNQLISYFSWRTKVRKKDYRFSCLSFIFMYVYELLNGIGVKDAVDGYQKLCEIDEQYFSTGGLYYRYNTIGKWKKEYVIYHNISDTVITEHESENNKMIKHGCYVLYKPEEFKDEEVFQAIITVPYQNLMRSVIFKKDSAIMERITAKVYRSIYMDQNQSHFKDAVTCMEEWPWEPFSNAVFYETEKHADADYLFDEITTYHCRDGRWICRIIKMDGIIQILCGIVHETDRLLREYLGGYQKIKQKQEEAWITPYVAKALEEEREEERKRHLPKVNLDSAFLNQIRHDAALTQEALLTEEEREDVEEIAETKEVGETEEDVNLFILKTLLSGQDVSKYIHQHHLLPSVVTDAINEAYFDEVGDSILECDGETIVIVEDYRDDVEEILGGKL